MKKFFLIALFIFIIIVIILQFFRPELKNPSEDKKKFINANLQVPDDVMNQLEKSCFDCHSYRTKWPWYSKISPVVYLIKRDVEEGREHLNFSEWGDYSKSDMMEMLEDIEKEVMDDEMPLWIYLPMHPEAKLSADSKQMIAGWVKKSKEQILNK